MTVASCSSLSSSAHMVSIPAAWCVDRFEHVRQEATQTEIDPHLVVERAAKRSVRGAQDEPSGHSVLVCGQLIGLPVRRQIALDEDRGEVGGHLRRPIRGILWSLVGRPRHRFRSSREVPPCPDG